MRDAKLFFHNGNDPTAASMVVDLNSSEPHVGIAPMYSVTATGVTAGSSVYVDVSAADAPAGAYRVVARFYIIPTTIREGVTLLSVPLPGKYASWGYSRWYKTEWTGLTGGSLADGIDWGLRDGRPATKRYNA